MSAGDCPRIDDAGSYVLRAMSHADAEAYRYHLGDCEPCAAKVAELEFVSHALLSGVPQLKAPPAIRDRVMQTVRAEAELLQAAGAGADRPSRSAPRRFGWLGLRPLTGAVLASVLLALGLGAGALLTGGDDGGAMRTIAATIDPAQAPTGSAEMRLASSTGAKLVVAGMPEPPKGRIYQVWLDYPNDAKPPLATDAFFSVNRRGTASVDVPGDLKGVSQVLVTSEPMGGSTVPSGPPLITVKTVA